MKQATSRLQISYIYSYMFIFLVPFSIMALLLYHNSVSSLREEIEITNINNLVNIKSLTDSRMQELGKIGALISIDPKLTPYMVSSNDLRPEAIAELRKYKENSSIINSLYLFYHKQNEVFSAEGFMSVDTFLEYRTNLKDSNQYLFTKELSQITYPQISTDLKPFGDNPAYMYPLPHGPARSYGTVFMELEDTFFTDMIRNILGSYEGNVYIIDQNNQVVEMFSNDNEINIDSAQVNNILNNQSQISEVTINNTNYSVSKVTSETSHWSFVTVLPTKQFFNKVSEFKTYIISMIAFIIIAASIVTIYIARRQFHPIKKIIELARKDKSFQSTSKNEWENLRKSLENMYSQHEYLNNKFEKQEPLIRDHCLLMLLQGQTHAVNQSKVLFDSHQLSVHRPYSFVFVTSLSKEQLSEINTKELEVVSSQLLADSQIYSVELINDKIMAYIVNANTINTNKKKKFLEQFTNLLSENQTTSIIGVGETYKGMEHINRSFIEATAAYENAKQNEKNGIISFEEIKNSQETLWLPKEHLLKLTHSYKQGNAKVATESLRCLFNWINTSKTSIYLITHMQYDIINSIIKTLTEMDIEINPEKLHFLMDTSSSKKTELKLIDFTDEICKEISCSNENQKKQLQVEIIDYIKGNFNQYNLSLDSMAQKFNLTASYLSRFIKDETNITFSQYVWELRLAEVKRQLIETDSPIKTIISEVGYIDASNFTRKFKNSVGLTPGQYRNSFVNIKEAK